MARRMSANARKVIWIFVSLFFLFFAHVLKHAFACFACSSAVLRSKRINPRLSFIAPGSLHPCLPVCRVGMLLSG